MSMNGFGNSSSKPMSPVMWTIDINSDGTLASATAALMTSSESLNGRPIRRVISSVARASSRAVT